MASAGLHRPVLFGLGLLGVLYTMFMWWRDVIKEAQHGATTPASSSCTFATA